MKTNEPDQSCFLCLSWGISDEVHQNDLEGSNGKDCYELMIGRYKFTVHCKTRGKTGLPFDIYCMFFELNYKF